MGCTLNIWMCTKYWDVYFILGCALNIGMYTEYCYEHCILGCALSILMLLSIVMCTEYLDVHRV